MTVLPQAPPPIQANPLWPAIEEFIKRALAKAIRGLRLAVGTVVISPLQGPDDPLMVIFDGSETAVPVKMIRAFNVFPDARVVCGKVGKDWTALGVFINTSEANIVAGIPGAGRFEFDPYTVVGRIYDPNSRMVVEMDQQLGVWVTDPDGEPNNRVRMRTEIGQLVLSQSPGDDADYWLARLVTSKGNDGLASEYVFTQIEGATKKPGTDGNLITLSGEADDNTFGPEIRLTSFGDDLPGSVQVLTDGEIGLVGLDAGSTLDMHGFAEVQLDTKLLAASCNSINAQAVTSGTDTTTSGTFVNMAGTGSVTSFNFSKLYANTRIRADVHCSAYATGAAADFEVAVRINATDYVVFKEAVLLNTRLPYSGVRFISSVPVGNYTVQMRWRRSGGSGTLTRDTANWMSVACSEVSS